VSQKILPAKTVNDILQFFFAQFPSFCAYFDEKAEKVVCKLGYGYLSGQIVEGLVNIVIYGECNSSFRNLLPEIMMSVYT